MNLLAPISSIMSKDVLTVHPTDSLLKVQEIFEQSPVHHLPVTEGLKLVGMLSKSDFLFFKRGFNSSQTEKRMDDFRLKTHTVKDIMIKRLAKLEPDDKINVALEVFKENLFHALPVVQNDRLLGIVTTYDIINHLAQDGIAFEKYGPE